MSGEILIVGDGECKTLFSRTFRPDFFHLRFGAEQTPRGSFVR